jgi:hypothetical protein
MGSSPGWCSVECEDRLLALSFLAREKKFFCAVSEKNVAPNRLIKMLGVIREALPVGFCKGI